MSVTKYLSLPVRYRIWKPLHIHLIFKDMVAPNAPTFDHNTHLSAAVDWLCRAQNQRDGLTDSGGVSAGWSFEDEWLPSYPETSGYIVETFVEASIVLARPELIQRAHRILDWELSIQNTDGSFPGHFGEPGSHPVIFNTGQIMHGMNCGYLHLQRQECLEAAIRAGYWLLNQQDNDGCWRRSEHNGIPHTYNTRAAWALLQTGLIANDKKLIDSATRNIEWALTQQNENGWFETNAFTVGAEPFTHTIAYAVRGILEAGLLLDRQDYVEAALKTSRALAKVQGNDGAILGTFDKNWRSSAYYVCLTGLAQIALNWGRLMQATQYTEFRPHVDNALLYLKKRHRIDNSGGVYDGGIAGSFPFWGRYSMFEYPNWAAKFFADALMVDQQNQSVNR